MTVTDAAELLLMEYLESPDLSLTHMQVESLCELPAEVADAALGILADAGFITQTSDGRYRRTDSLPPSATVERLVQTAS